VTRADRVWHVASRCRLIALTLPLWTRSDSGEGSEIPQRDCVPRFLESQYDFTSLFDNTNATTVAEGYAQ